jgi:hypothetical protein
LFLAAASPLTTAVQQQHQQRKKLLGSGQPAPLGAWLLFLAAASLLTAAFQQQHQQQQQLLGPGQPASRRARLLSQQQLQQQQGCPVQRSPNSSGCGFSSSSAAAAAPAASPVAVALFHEVSLLGAPSGWPHPPLSRLSFLAFLGPALRRFRCSPAFVGGLVPAFFARLYGFLLVRSLPVSAVPLCRGGPCAWACGFWTGGAGPA